MEIKVLKDILGANEQIAHKNREILDSNHVTAVNIMASPGAGKTSTILETIKALEGKVRIGVIEGDISSNLDAETIARKGIPVVQINTGGACHLEAGQIQKALDNLPLADIDLLFIENVGNLVCPAEFNLGEHKKVLISSVPEGDDKPFKYPLMFEMVDVVLLNKIDLKPYLNFDSDRYTQAVKGINQKVNIIELSCTTSEGVQKWTSWLKSHLNK